MKESQIDSLIKEADIQLGSVQRIFVDLLYGIYKKENKLSSFEKYDLIQEAIVATSTLTLMLGNIKDMLFNINKEESPNDQESTH